MSIFKVQNRLFTMRLIIVGIMVSFSLVCFAQFGGGNGTEANPWQIATANHLNNVRNYLGADHNNKFFIQTADINLGVAPWNTGQGWVPIGSSAVDSFQGNYNGNGYIISNLTINRATANFQGLFGLTMEASITNIGLKDINIRGNQSVGGLIGYQDAGTVVQSCYVTGNLTGCQYIGGLIGRINNNNSQVLDCLSQVNVTRVEGNDEIANPVSGGLIGYMQDGQLRRSYAAGRIVTTPSNRSAAIIGSRINGDLSSLYWNVETANTQYSVGREDIFPGSTTLQMIQRVTYQGFDFENAWNINDHFSYPYPVWQERLETFNIPGPRNLNGESGNRWINLTWQRPVIPRDPNGYNVYRDGVRINQTPVLEREYMVTGLTNAVFYNFFVTALYDEGESSQSNVIRVAPSLFAGGSGTQANPYLIRTAEQLNTVRIYLSAYFKQIEDINMTGFGNWTPIGTNANRFTGHYDGDGYTITGLRINEGSYAGLFGYLDNNASLKNLGLVDVNLTNTGVYSGPLVGTANNSSIRNCYSTGTVNTISSQTGGLIGHIGGNTEVIDCYSDVDFTTSLSQSGGLIGYMFSGAVVNCYSKGTVTATGTGVNTSREIGGLIGRKFGGDVTNCTSKMQITVPAVSSNVGGLIGQNGGNVTNSYAIGSITGGQTNLGGLIGYNTGSVTNCYSIGSIIGGQTNVGGLIGNSIGTVTNSYWDTVRSGLENSSGGSGRVTRQMTYPYDELTYVGWNFEQIWQHDQGMFINNGYPFLHYEEIVRLDAPEVDITTTIIDNIKHLLISWEGIEGANSYKIYSSDNAYAADWGEPIATTDETSYSEALTDGSYMFYKVIASPDAMP